MNKVKIYPFVFLFFLAQLATGNTQNDLEKEVPNETMYVHTNKDIYFAGDELFFKTYLLTDSLNILKSKIQYISLNAENGAAVFSFELKADNGFWSGMVNLPDTLATGYYRLTGWTNNMIIAKKAIFTKQLTIINRFDESAIEKLAKSNPTPMRIFVEGQCLTAEKSSKVQVQVNSMLYSNQNSLPLIENDRDTIQNIFIDDFGFASFIITPKPNSSYSIGSEPTASLCEKEPISLQIIDFNNDSLSIAAQYPWGPFSLCIEQLGEIKWEQRFTEKEVPSNAKISTRLLRHGLFNVKLLDSNRNMVKSILWVKQPLPLTVKLITNDTNYGPRKEVRLSIDSIPTNDRIASASISVTRSETLVLNSPNIVSYFCANPIDTIVASRNLYNSQTPIAFASSNQLFAPLQKWPLYDTEIMVVPENHGSLLSGMVINQTTKKPIGNTLVVLNTPDTVVNLKYAKTFDDGSFFFFIDDYLQNKPLYLNTFGKSAESLGSKIIVRKKFNAIPFEPSASVFSKNLLDYIQEGKMVRRAMKAFGHALETTPSKPLLKKSIPLYSSPTQTFKFSDYVPFDHFQEISTEIIPVLRIRKERNQYKAKMLNTRTKTFFPEEPTFFLNGVYVKDIKEVIQLSSKELERTETVSEARFYGNLSFNGIVSLFTHKTLMDEITYGGVKVETNIQYTNVQSYPTNSANQKESQMADLRETLLWVPNVDFTSSGSSEMFFFTSDIKGNYTITLEGVTKNGVPFSYSSTITVK
jgi:hypothetical protein